ncbi:MAG TPA: high-potential iron-sulfur protein [Dyella sp.]|uniref:high-potential iron-sulfur protein n=1 Tax=Dyella sp. TaxID=1869338 RepID=UPI002C896E46|nr:high-potential iron-sulfur protein [Dyella sp.]HTV86153.1 high-potential iron-sulfur protein [Dyella sp.]
MSHHSESNPGRRRFLQLATAAVAVAATATLTRFAHADDQMHVTDADPTAKALGYVEDATTTKSALYKAGSTCANCQFYSGSKSGYGPCQLFPGKVVNAKGWCTSYTIHKG